MKNQIVTQEQNNQMQAYNQSQIDFANPAQMQDLLTVADQISHSKIIPQHYRGNPSDCFVAIVQAKEMGINPFSFMRGSYVVHGQLGLYGKFIISLLNESNKIKGSLRWEFKNGENGLPYRCECFATLPDGSEVSYHLTWNDVTANKWESNPKWRSMPKKMFMYRTASWLADTYFPEVINGMQSAESIEDDQYIIIENEDKKSELTEINLFENGAVIKDEPKKTETKKIEQKPETKPAEKPQPQQEQKSVQAVVQEEKKSQSNIEIIEQKGVTVEENNLVEEQPPLPEEPLPFYGQNNEEVIKPEPPVEKPKRQKLSEKYTPEQLMKMKQDLIVNVNELGNSEAFCQWLVERGMLKEGQVLVALNNTNVARLMGNWDRCTNLFNDWLKQAMGVQE